MVQPAVVFSRGFLSATGRDLAKRLDATFSTLRVIEQDDVGPPAGLDNVAAGLVLPTVLRSKVQEVSLLACCCLADVLRLYAPEAPYTDDQKLVRRFRVRAPRSPCAPARAPCLTPICPPPPSPPSSPPLRFRTFSG
jgi:hypothetical protein